MDINKKSISNFVIAVSLLLLVCKVPITRDHCYAYILLINNVVSAVRVRAVALRQWCGDLALNSWPQLSYFWQTRSILLSR